MIAPDLAPETPNQLRPEEMEIGIDLVDIARLERVVDRWGRKFLTRIFTDAEIAYCYEKAQPARSLAARFAAKEALAKTLRGPTAPRWKDVEVITDSRGKPGYRFSGRAEGAEASLSISHTHDQAVAVALLLRRPGDLPRLGDLPRPGTLPPGTAT